MTASTAARIAGAFCFLLGGLAEAKLLRPEVELVLVEPFAGFVFPVTDLENTLQRTHGAKTTWSPRFGLGVVGGARVWQPLNLDVGLRLGLSFQKGLTKNETRDSYTTSLKLLEMVPFARGAVFPFGTEKWGISLELGLGLLLGFGGEDGSKDFPPESQLVLRIRAGAGVLWMWSASMGLSIEALTLVTDVPVTGFFQDEVGTMLSLETAVGWIVRF